MLIASGKVGIDEMMELCQCVFDGNSKPDDWKISIMMPIFKRKGVMNCGAYRRMKTIEACYKGCRKGAGEKNKGNADDGQ